MDDTYGGLFQKQRGTHKHAKAEHQADFYSTVKGMLKSIDNLAEL